MKTFNFRLAKVLKVRVRAEDAARLELGRTVGVLSEIERTCAANGVERERARAARFADGDLNSARRYDDYLMRLDVRADQLRNEALDAAEAMEKARVAYIAASAERKSIDKVKERRFAEYRKERFAEEEKAVDDTGGRQR
jgi:flagellar FliJ protein